MYFITEDKRQVEQHAVELSNSNLPSHYQARVNNVVMDLGMNRVTSQEAKSRLANIEAELKTIGIEIYRF